MDDHCKLALVDVPIPKTKRFLLWDNLAIPTISLPFQNQGFDPCRPCHRLHAPQIQNHLVPQLRQRPINIMSSDRCRRRGSHEGVLRSPRPLWRTLVHRLGLGALSKEIPVGISLSVACWKGDVGRMHRCLVSVRALLRPMSQLSTDEARLRLLLLFHPTLHLFSVFVSLWASWCIAFLLEVLSHLLDLPHSISGFVLLCKDFGHKSVRCRR